MILRSIKTAAFLASIFFASSLTAMPDRETVENAKAQAQDFKAHLANGTMRLFDATAQPPRFVRNSILEYARIRHELTRAHAMKDLSRLGNTVRTRFLEEMRDAGIPRRERLALQHNFTQQVERNTKAIDMADYLALYQPLENIVR